MSECKRGISGHLEQRIQRSGPAKRTHQPKVKPRVIYIHSKQNIKVQQ